MARKRKIRPVPHKGVVRSAKAIQKDPNIRSDKAEQFLQDIAPFLTKKGELRKNISQKNLEKFNKIVADYKKGGTPRKSKIKKGLRKQLETARRNQTYDTKKEQRLYQDIFGHDAVRDLMKSHYFESGQVETIIKTHGHLGKNKIIDAFRVIQAINKMNLPAEVEEYFPMDDAASRVDYFLRADPAEQERLLEWIFEDEGID